jgi:hypothetical protein
MITTETMFNNAWIRLQIIHVSQRTVEYQRAVLAALLKVIQLVK